MARDPADGDAFVFDLVDDDAASDPAAASTGSPGVALAGAASEDRSADDDLTGVRVASGGPARWLRRAAPAAAVLAVALGTGYALDGVREAERIDRISRVSGGVVDASSPLTQTWHWAGDVGTGRVSAVQGTAQVATLGDLLVFVSEDDLLALEPTSGGVAWAVPLGEDPDCGPVGYAGWEETVAAETIVCLQGRDEDRAAITVGPDGVASVPRVLDAADDRLHGSARPGPDGTVLRAERVGPTSAPDLGDAECDSTGDCTGTVRGGRDIRFRAEDALTGAERWSVTVPFEATPATYCYPHQGEVWGELRGVLSNGNAPDPEPFGARIGDHLVDVYGCGANASVTADGVLLRGAGEPGTSYVTRLAGGGYLALGSGTATNAVVYSADGEVDETFADYVYEASAVDGSGLLLGAGEGGSGLRAYEPDGTPRWEGVLRSSIVWFAAEVGKTAVVLAEDGTAHGFDTSTGEERWVTDLTSDDGYAPPVWDTFTDGRHVLLRMGGGGANLRLVSLDAVTGERVWEREAAEIHTTRQDATLVAVGGNLLAVTPLGVSGLG